MSIQIQKNPLTNKPEKLWTIQFFVQYWKDQLRYVYAILDNTKKFHLERFKERQIILSNSKQIAELKPIYSNLKPSFRFNKGIYKQFDDSVNFEFFFYQINDNIIIGKPYFRIILSDHIQSTKIFKNRYEYCLLWQSERPPVIWFGRIIVCDFISPHLA